MLTHVAIRGTDKVWSLPAPNRHYHVIRAMVEGGETPPIRGEQGFLTEEGVFLRRRPAEIHARLCGQLTGALIGSILTSEDLW